MPSQPFNGVVLVNKPGGMTSHDVVSRIRRFFGLRKVGHTGSLDPLATGMLPVCLGQATKFAQFSLSADKQYTVSARLGQTTDTGDADGQVLTEAPVEVSESAIGQLLPQFVGPQAQIPPMYSAIKHQGTPLYKLARAGQVVEREPRQIEVYGLELLALDGPVVTFKAQVSKGTYIRVLVEDVGQALGCGAHVATLHRDWVHPFETAVMTDLAKIGELEKSVLADLVLPIEQMLADLPLVTLSDASQVEALGFGQAIDFALDAYAVGTQLRVQAPDYAFLGIGIVTDEQQLRAKKWLA